MPRFARVAPLCRTPVGVDAFDYLIPEGFTVAVGDLVRVPLRKQRVEAVVLSLSESSPFAAKARPLDTRPPLTHFGAGWIALSEWLAARTFQSVPTIAKAWLRLLPKKTPAWTTHAPDRPASGTLETRWSTVPEQDLLELLRDMPAKGRTLVLVPYAQQAQALAEAAGGECLLSDDPKTVATSTWMSFCAGETRLLFTTRVGAWLGLYAERVILLEPENDEHKQDELSPRFDARLVAAWLYQRQGAHLITIGCTPAIHVNADAPRIDLHPQFCLKQSRGYSEIPVLTHQALERFLEGESTVPRCLIHPIRGMRARTQCRTCGEVIACQRCGSALRRLEREGWCDLCHVTQLLPEECPRCHGQEFSGSSPGIELIKRAWTQAGHPPIEWRDGSPLALATPFAPGTRVLVTDPHLLGGASEDVRRTERLCRAYRALAGRIAAAGGELLLQVPEEDTTRWLTWLTPEGIHSHADQERQARAIFRYPPSIRLAKILIDGSPETAQPLTDRLQAALRQQPAFLELRGPFPVEHRANSRPRSVVHALFRPETTEDTLLHTLKPFAAHAKIDLDPIAFLR